MAGGGRPLRGLGERVSLGEGLSRAVVMGGSPGRAERPAVAGRGGWGPWRRQEGTWPRRSGAGNPASSSLGARYWPHPKAGERSAVEDPSSSWPVPSAGAPRPRPSCRLHAPPGLAQPQRGVQPPRDPPITTARDNPRRGSPAPPNPRGDGPRPAMLLSSRARSSVLQLDGHEPHGCVAHVLEVVDSAFSGEWTKSWFRRAGSP